MLVRTPFLVGAAGLALGVSAGAAAGAASWNSSSLQPRLAAIFWTGLIVLSLWIIWLGHSRGHSLLARDWMARGAAESFRKRRLILARTAVTAVVAGLVALGFAQQLEIGEQNLNFDLTKHPSYGSIVAAQWIADHSAESAVVMARQMDVVHHYAHRKVVWFAPISDPHVLMQGIRRLKTNFVIVTNTWNYYRPSDAVCVDALLQAYPQSFRIAREEPRFRIIEVVARSSVDGGGQEDDAVKPGQ
jgi:hypothetical protein